MAFAIGFQCTACGVCSSSCPNDAIRGHHPHYYIEPWLCTECLFFEDDPTCASRCPYQAIVPRELKPGKDWITLVPLGAIHPALRKIRF